MLYIQYKTFVYEIQCSSCPIWQGVECESIQSSQEGGDLGSGVTWGRGWCPGNTIQHLYQIQFQQPRQSWIEASAALWIHNQMVLWVGVRVVFFVNRYIRLYVFFYFFCIFVLHTICIQIQFASTHWPKMQKSWVNVAERRCSATLQCRRPWPPSPHPCTLGLNKIIGQHFYEKQKSQWNQAS